VFNKGNQGESMRIVVAVDLRGKSRWLSWPAALLTGVLLLCGQNASAIPAFARQTGQNCVACHAGGQFPELTPYGRMFKMTGYTIGERALPLAVMAAGSVAHMKNADGVNASLQNNVDPNATLNAPMKSGTPKLDVASLFLAGKITDNIGAFTQFTADFYGDQNDNGEYSKTHTSVDNMDFRYADHLISPSMDLVWGVSVNNNPSVSDPWNTSWGWMQYVPASGGPGSNTFLDANAPYPGSGLPGDFYAGATAYAYWNRLLYGEFGFYRSATGLAHFMNAGNDINNSRLRGTNPYWRLALTKDWGAHNFMVGASGMVGHPYDTTNGVDTGDSQSYQRTSTAGLDAQYQYLLDPHTVTVQAAWQHQGLTPSQIDATNNGTAASGTDIFRIKSSYVYRAFVGGSVSYFNQTGDFTTATRGATIEAFVMPIQNIRVGLQYTLYDKLANIDSPHDGNTTYLYVWAAF
jgi:hypothetical protein